MTSNDIDMDLVVNAIRDINSALQWKANQPYQLECISDIIRELDEAHNNDLISSYEFTHVPGETPAWRWRHKDNG